ncbi:unnamed protein product [Trichogramma brassicae]|uniref:Uncharacterized protein n=1 Tax=Trichogramma brassicae TaxID=86971 RepID=A0A6H5I299_9HYME|nr:unnamed protein product [Trichogramma brassicae]
MFDILIICLIVLAISADKSFIGLPHCVTECCTANTFTCQVTRNFFWIKLHKRIQKRWGGSASASGPIPGPAVQDK